MKTIPLLFVLASILLLSACTKVEVIVSGGKSAGRLRCNPNHLSLGMLGKDQEKDTWCWAASGQAILAYYGYGMVDQCKLITKARVDRITRDTQGLPPGYFTDCCHEPTIEWIILGSIAIPEPNSLAARIVYGKDCLDGGLPDEVFASYNIQYTKTAHYTALKWNALQHQICDFGPFIFMVEWLGGGLHTGVVEGYHVTNVPGYERLVELDDHGHGGFFLKPYDEFVSDPTEHRHYRDYINFRTGS